MEAFRGLAELAYFISGIVLASVAIIGLKQVRIMKKDMITRMDRAAKEKAIEYSTRYLSNFVSLVSTFCNEYKKHNTTEYKGSISDFTFNSLQEKHLDNAKKRFDILSWLPAMNELQSIAAAFTSGVADDRTGFNIIGRTYCVTVQCNYDILSMSRQAKVCDYYQSIIDLYNVWAPRLNKAELEAERVKMEECISCIPDKNISPIGS